MRALSLTQPWASLMAIGAKRYETRSWSTPYRGPLAIAAAKKFPEECRRLCYKNTPFSEALHAGGFETLRHLIDVTGHVIAVVDLVDCVRVHGDVPQHSQVPPAEHEESFGDYTGGRFAWITANLRRLATPVPARGSLGVWTMTDDTVAAIAAQFGGHRG